MDDPSLAPGLAVVGADHLHVFGIVDALVRAGVRTVAHTRGGAFRDDYCNWRTDSQERSLEDILRDSSINIVVTAGIPADRAAVAVAAIKAGKAVVSAKPGVTSRAQLEAIRQALTGRAGRAWTVVFTERFENRAVLAAVELVRSGGIGEVVRIRGTGPHTLAASTRPGWFFEPDRSGGILVDLASHQVDEFLALTGDPALVRVIRSTVGNVASPAHPCLQDIGSLMLVADGVQGCHEVDFLSPAGLGTWGDVRLEVTGTTGTCEVRANIDVTGRSGEEHLIHVDADGARRVDVSDITLDWAEIMLADVADDGERLMTQSHVLAVSELTLDAQEHATAWGSG